MNALGETDIRRSWWDSLFAPQRLALISLPAPHRLTLISLPAPRWLGVGTTLHRHFYRSRRATEQSTYCVSGEEVGPM